MSRGIIAPPNIPGGGYYTNLVPKMTGNESLETVCKNLLIPNFCTLYCWINNDITYQYAKDIRKRVYGAFVGFDSTLKENKIFGHATISRMNTINLIKFIDYKFNYIFDTAYTITNNIGFCRTFTTGSSGGGIVADAGEEGEDQWLI